MRVSIYYLHSNLFPLHLTFCVVNVNVNVNVVYSGHAIHLSHSIWVPSVELFTVADLIELVCSIGFQDKDSEHTSNY